MDHPSPNPFHPGTLIGRLSLLFALLFSVAAAETIPPAPKSHFNDYVGVVSRPVAEQLNLRLEQYERDSSNQLLVAIFRHMESNSSVEASAKKANEGQQERKVSYFGFTLAV